MFFFLYSLEEWGKDHKFFCPVCDEKITTGPQYEAHRRKHSLHLKAPNLCSKCGFVARHPETIENHLQLHSRANILQCVRCEYLSEYRPMSKHLKKTKCVEYRTINVTRSTDSPEHAKCKLKTRIYFLANETFVFFFVNKLLAWNGLNIVSCSC